MKPVKSLLSTIALSLTLTGALGGAMVATSTATLAASTTENIVVDNIRARPSLGMAKNSAAFFTVHNKSDKDNKLVSAAGDVAKKIQLHNHIKDNGVFRMRQVEFIAMPAHGEAKLAPGGYHVMLIGLNRKLKVGDSFKLKLSFANGETQTITVPVMKIGGHGMKMGQKKMDGMKKMDEKSMDGMKKKMPAN